LNEQNRKKRNPRNPKEKRNEAIYNITPSSPKRRRGLCFQRKTAHFFVFC
jgi:hypothetical protein